ncbi:MAG: TonB-dependent receptor [Flavobacteriaceae bacterium]|nr:TonB-dependent receptor [Flavobacteriaceae bacterium]
MKKLICMLCVMAISVTTYSQNSIEGSILNSETNEPVIAATVYLPKLERGTMTSADGKFHLNNIPKGNFQLVISSLGFTTQTVEVNTSLTKPLVIQLQTSAIEMEAVIVSTPFHKLQSENVVLVARETVDNLSKSGAVTLAEGITQIPGVESITTGAGIGKPVIRGLSANRVLVYTQGVRLENQQFGDEHGLGVSSSGVESVEVIKGPASLLYGSDALGGVLYLNPEKYAISDSSDADAKITYHTNSLGTEANAGFKTSGERLKFLLRGNYAANSDYKSGNGLRVTNSRFEEIDIKTGLGYQDTNYRGDLRYNNTNTGIPEEIEEQSTSKDMLLPNQKLDNHILSFDNKLFLKNSSLDLKVGYLFNNRKEFEEDPENLDANTPALEMHLETLNYDVKYNSSKWGNFEAIFGIQGMYQTNKNLGMEILIPNANVADIGFLATSNYHLEKVDFQAGLRFDSRKIDSEEHGVFGEEKYFAPIERDFTSYNGAFGVKFDILNSLIARVNVATGFRAPNLSELTSNGIHEGTNRFEIGNPNLDNEQNFQLDLSLEYRNEHFEIFANSFYNKINNYIFLNPSGEIKDENPVFEYIQNNARLYGGEAGLHLHPHPLDWLHLESSVEMVRGEQENGENLPLIPATSFTNTLRIEFDQIWSLKNNYGFVTLKSTLSQNDISEFETNTPGYSLLSAGIGSSFKFKGQTLDLRISGNNLLDKTYISHLSRLKQDGIPNRGRNVTLSLQTSF